jgi:hypothetical protein
MDNNMERLLTSAYRPTAARASFKVSLLQGLREELNRATAGVSRRAVDSAILEQNLARLLASAATVVEARSSFKERLRWQMEQKELVEAQRRRLPLWVPALAATAVILLLGMVIYPIFWAGRGLNIAADVNQGTAVVTQTKPVFFNLVNKAVSSTLVTGDMASLAVGDEISVGADSGAVVTLFGTSNIKLFPGSELIITELKAQGKEGSPLARVRLDTGRATSEINGLKFEIATPCAVATVSGTAFRVEVISDGHTFLATDDGVVQLTMEGNTCQVSAGEEVQAIKGQTLAVRAQKPPPLLIDSPAQPEVSSSPVTLSGRTDPEATITVDGEAVPVDINGAFSTVIDLKPGANPVTVVASSPVGRTTTVNIVLILE